MADSWEVFLLTCLEAKIFSIMIGSNTGTMWALLSSTCRTLKLLNFQVTPIWGLGNHMVVLYADAPHPGCARVSLWGDSRALRQHQSSQTQTSFLTTEMQL